VSAVVALVPYSGQPFLPAFCNDQSGADTMFAPFLALGGTRDITAPLSMTRSAVNRIPASHYLVEMDIPHEYEEFPGEHNWDYWDQHVQDAIWFHGKALKFWK